MAWDNLISRGIWIIIQPSNFLFFILLISFIFQQFAQKKSYQKSLAVKVSAFCFVILFFAGYTNLSSWLLYPLESRFQKYTNQATNGPYSGIIVLGGSEKISISTAVVQASLNSYGERLISTAYLSRKFPELPIIHTGGTRYEPDEWSENDVAKKFFLDVGVNIDRIRFEDKSYNTNTNATESIKLIKEGESQKWLLVTSAFHMPRSVGAFRKVNFNIQPYPVDYKTTLKYDGFFEINFSQNLKNFDIAIHEYVGLIAYYITGRSNELFPSPDM